MPTRLLLVRHGGTVWSADDRFAGASDVELSDAGRAQAAALGKRLAGVPIAAAYCSTMRRAVDTATIICQGRGLTLAQVSDLREIDHGQWEGRTPQDVKERWPAELAAWEADPLLVPAPGGDTGLVVLSRALPALRRIVADHAAQTVLVVSHKATIRLVICALLGCRVQLYRQLLGQDSAALNVLDFANPDQARLTVLNDTAHYAPLPT